MTKQELQRRQELWARGYWEIPEHIDDTGFNYDWRPHPTEPPQTYQFGTQHQRTGGPRFVIPESAGIVYVESQRVIRKPDPQKFSRLRDTKLDFDWSWHPDDTDPPYIYVFGVEFVPANEAPYLEYYVDGGTEKKFMSGPTARIHTNPEYWVELIEGAKLDTYWHHHPYDPPYIYVFGNKWNDATTEPTLEYHVPGSTQKKYIFNIVAELPQNAERWTVQNDYDRDTFDFSWRPNPYAPPQTYQWENNGPIYEMPGSTGVVYMNRSVDHDLPVPQYYITTTLEDLIELHPTEVFWALNPELKYERFDFNWKPNSENFMHINAFGNHGTVDSGTYYVNAPLWFKGHREINYVSEHEITIETNVDMYYIVRGTDISNQYDVLKERFPHLQKTRFMNSWVDTINRCIRKATTKFMWILSSELDYSNFEFDYYPPQWHRQSVTVFGTQWHRWGNTYLVNTATFAQDTQHVKLIEHLSNVNYVSDPVANITHCLYDIVYIDYGNKTDSLEKITRATNGRNITVLPYDTSYYNTLKCWATGLAEWEIRSEHLLWVCTSVTDYDDFNFTWTSDPFQREQLHVFATECGKSAQKFGDTFLLNLNVFRSECDDFDKLEMYAKKINYINLFNCTRRLPHPVIHHQHDSQAEAIKTIETPDFPYVELTGVDVIESQPVVPNLWDQEHATVVVASRGASRIFVPTPALTRVRDEVYDYPHIETVDQPDPSRLLDVIFFSNGEPGADENFEYLRSLGLPNRIIHQRGVKGRVASQHAAAETSETGWYFLINAKLRVNPTFDFTWQPDRLQRAKHYIFSATNPVNGLEYGHQAIVANNSRLTLATVADGLDFTMSSPHEVVDMNCGVAYYNTDPWTTWRTAFREAIKLQYYSENGASEENRDRLETWLRVGNGENGQWSTGGAYDAVEYYHSVNGDLVELMRSYDWAWLEEYYRAKYGKK